MKRKSAALIAGVLILLSQSALTISAAPADELPELSVCPQYDCTLTENHYHDGTEYICHSTDDGHSYHSYCDQSGCTMTGEHKHSHSYTNSDQENNSHHNKGHGRHRAARHH